jgi:hypothetical protein
VVGISRYQLVRRSTGGVKDGTCWSTSVKAPLLLVLNVAAAGLSSLTRPLPFPLPVLLQTSSQESSTRILCCVAICMHGGISYRGLGSREQNVSTRFGVR